VEARVDGHVSSEVTKRFGVRSVGSLVLPSGGRAFTVNGRIIRMTGGAWVPDFLMSWSAQRYRDEVRLMAEGNHTIVRVNGCGIVPPDAFFDACDRYGLLVWEDLSRTSVTGACRKDGLRTWNPPHCDPAIYLDNMRDCIVRLRGRPSLLLWCGSNEAAPQEDTGKALQNEVLPALDGTRPWLPDSHEAPVWRKEDLHTWTGGPYWFVRLPEYFRIYAHDPTATCRNEIGVFAPPPINCLAKSIPDHDQPTPEWFPWNRDLGYHDAMGNVGHPSDKVVREELGEPACLTEYSWMGDVYCNLSYRAIYEAANKFRPRNAGTHIWKINAAWPSVVQQVFDWYLRCNGGYYGMRSACQPLHVQHSADDHTVQVVSTLARPRPNLRVRATLVDTAGHVERMREYTVLAAADATTRVGPLPDVVNNGRLHFLALDLIAPEGRPLDRVVTCVQANSRFCELLKLPPVDIEARVVGGQSEVAGETLYKVSVRNASTVPAVHVWLEVICGDQGNEVLPAFWSDNALTLLPGERRELIVRFRPNLLAAAPPHLMVEGWNVTPREWTVNDGRAVPLAMHVTGCEVRREAKLVKLRFKATQGGAEGPRWTTWLTPVKVDGNVVRYVRIGLRNGATSSAILTLVDLAPGEHRISVGDGSETRVVYGPHSPGPIREP
jgi:hypothetical protein